MAGEGCQDRVWAEFGADFGGWKVRLTSLECTATPLLAETITGRVLDYNLLTYF